MKVLIAPGRPAWTEAVALAHGPVVVFDPLAGALRPLERTMRLLGRRSAATAIEVDAQRRLLAGRLPRLPIGTREVIAPTLAASEAFRLARSIGASCTLVMDLPHLDRLHQDLDAAHARWPDCAFLQNHRAAPALLERQAHEWSLADRVLVRSRFAARGHPDARPLPAGPASVQAAAAGPLTIRLAGLATGRSGAAEALAAIAQLPGARLSVRLGEGAWPAALHSHAQVIGPAACHVVWAPSWVETGAAEVAAAERAGIPVVATPHAAGWTSAALVAAGDVAGLVEATLRLTQRQPLRSWTAPPTPDTTPPA
jgi:hypothetical protein